GLPLATRHKPERIGFTRLLRRRLPTARLARSDNGHECVFVTYRSNRHNNETSNIFDHRGSNGRICSQRFFVNRSAISNSQSTANISVTPVTNGALGK